MSIQALAPVIESGLFKGVEYGILLAIANHADRDGYAWVGYETLAEEARSEERHVKRVVKRLTGDAKAAIERGEDGWALRKISTGGGPYGTNEYQLNIAFFTAAQQRLSDARKMRRMRSTNGGRTGVASDHPPHANRGDIPGCQDGPGVTEGGDSRSHPNRLPPSSITSAREGAPPDGAPSARSLPGPDWSEVRKALREKIGRDAFTLLAASLRADGQLITAPSMGSAEWVMEKGADFFKAQGYSAVCVSGEPGEWPL